MAKKKNTTKQDTPSDPVTSFLDDSGLLPVLKDNRVLLAAVGGALAGAAIATLLGSQKGKRVLTHATKSALDWAAKSGGKATGQKPKKTGAV